MTKYDGMNLSFQGWITSKLLVVAVGEVPKGGGGLWLAQALEPEALFGSRRLTRATALRIQDMFFFLLFEGMSFQSR